MKIIIDCQPHFVVYEETSPGSLEILLTGGRWVKYLKDKPKWYLHTYHKERKYLQEGNRLSKYL